MQRLSNEPRQMLTHMDLFSGIGGFALAARWAGMETIGFSEIEPYCCKILAENFPGIPNYGDITKLDGRTITADLITGGFPCQPFSLAGQQQGQDDERYLWPEMLRVIAECQPTWVLAENVMGIVSMALERVCLDLEGLGFEVAPLVIPACAVDAPHRRDRVWIVAYSKSNRMERSQRQNGESHERGIQPGGLDLIGDGSLVADAERSERGPSDEGGGRSQQGTYRHRETTGGPCQCCAPAPDDSRNGRGSGREGRPHPSNAGQSELAFSLAADADDQRQQQSPGSGHQERERLSDGSPALADDTGQQMGAARQPWVNGSLAAVTTDPAQPRCTELQGQCAAARTPGRREFAPEVGRLTERAFCRGYHGLSEGLDEDRRDRPFVNNWRDVPPLAPREKDTTDRLKALGNAIVPAVAYQILVALKEAYRAEND